MELSEQQNQKESTRLILNQKILLAIVIIANNIAS
jgi:hypothetical protein